ncbi:MAG: L-histidine N(alpha)-methyltransferase [Desulfuromonadales bacterium]|nr:L-histidine N(alpha)-methyltransferase [Desulfuromonadales bacterium]
MNVPRRRLLAGGFHAVLAGGQNIVLQTAGAADSLQGFARSVAAGLTRRPRGLDCRFLYDRQGSELYEQITCQPEYYPTRTEAAILAAGAPRLRALTGALSLLELGSGSSAKTGHLLSAWQQEDATVFYIPVDVSESALLQANQTLSASHPNTRVIGIHGTYEDALDLVVEASPVLLVFLGSTLGNFPAAEADRFLCQISAALGPQDFFLLGLDLVKDGRQLEAAYNDAAGVTAAFTRNLFARMNRELGSGLDLESIEHVARWQPQRRQIEIHARFHRPQTLLIRPLGERFSIAGGEEILVEISRKFEPAELPEWLAGCGLDLVEMLTDERRWFTVLLLRRSSPRARLN